MPDRKTLEEFRDYYAKNGNAAMAAIYQGVIDKLDKDNNDYKEQQLRGNEV